MFSVIEIRKASVKTSREARAIPHDVAFTFESCSKYDINEWKGAVCRRLADDGIVKLVHGHSLCCPPDVTFTGLKFFDVELTLTERHLN